jgi:adenylate kinase family enzyme
VEEFGFLHLSAGDLLRAEVARGTEQGKELAATMKEGNLVPAVCIKAVMQLAMFFLNAQKKLTEPLLWLNMSPYNNVCVCASRSIHHSYQSFRNNIMATCVHGN